ncbi:ComF family protein [Streptomyces sp. NPDC000658]|uniref:ComF family protein n=1 Tax=Streptomyces sp. NPDC000658 TaxID=3154266 RepID=UPI003322210C
MRCLKCDAAWSWATTFGRLVIVWKERNPDQMAGADGVVGNRCGPAAPIRHIEGDLEGGRHRGRVRPMALADVARAGQADTEGTAGRSREAERLAATAHAKAIRIERRARDRGILLFDDLFTTGQQMQAVGRLLRETGSAEVRGPSSYDRPGGADRQGALFDT